jgi:hypothetical protein
VAKGFEHIRNKLGSEYRIRDDLGSEYRIRDDLGSDHIRDDLGDGDAIELMISELLALMAPAGHPPKSQRGCEPTQAQTQIQTEALGADDMSYVQGHSEDGAVRVAYTEGGVARIAYTSYVQGHAEDGSARVASYTPLEDKVWRLARAHSEQARDLNAAGTGGTWHSLNSHDGGGLLGCAPRLSRSVRNDAEMAQDSSNSSLSDVSIMGTSSRSSALASDVSIIGTPSRLSALASDVSIIGTPSRLPALAGQDPNP